MKKRIGILDVMFLLILPIVAGIAFIIVALLGSLFPTNNTISCLLGNEGIIFPTICVLYFVRSRLDNTNTKLIKIIVYVTFGIALVTFNSLFLFGYGASRAIMGGLVW
jgi:hypothetical protein